LSPCPNEDSPGFQTSAGTVKDTPLPAELADHLDSISTSHFLALVVKGANAFEDCAKWTSDAVRDSFQPQGSPQNLEEMVV
jgi:hypothetical protein